MDNENTSGNDVHDIERGSDLDIEGHEIHLDETFPEQITIENVDCKVLVLPSSEEYLKEIKNDKTMSEFEDLFWCTHGYSDRTKKKSLMPSGAIKSLN